MELKNLFLFLLLICGTNTIAQDYLNVNGTVVEKDDSGVSEAIISILQDGVSLDTVYTDENGKFDFNLDLGYIHQIKFAKKDYIYKIVQFDSKNMSAEIMEGGFFYPLQIKLYQPIDGMNLSVFDLPLGKARYQFESNSIEFDKEYTAQRKLIVRKELDRIEKIDLDKKISANKKFKKLIRKADKLNIKNKDLKAIELYKKALIIFPKTDAVERQIDLIFQRMGI